LNPRLRHGAAPGHAPAAHTPCPPTRGLPSSAPAAPCPSAAAGRCLSASEGEPRGDSTGLWVQVGRPWGREGGEKAGSCAPSVSPGRLWRGGGVGGGRAGGVVLLLGRAGSQEVVGPRAGAPEDGSHLRLPLPGCLGARQPAGPHPLRPAGPHQAAAGAGGSARNGEELCHSRGRAPPWRCCTGGPGPGLDPPRGCWGACPRQQVTWHPPRPASASGTG